MVVASSSGQAATVILLVCGCVYAVTITPLPYKGNEPGYRFPRGTATFLDQEEGNRIRRQMLAGQGMPGFYGGNNHDKDNRSGGYDRRDGYNYDRRDGYDNYGRRDGYDNYDRRDGYDIYDNEIDHYNSRKPKDYYPNYNPEGSSTRRECDQSGSRNWSGSRGYSRSGYNGRWGESGKRGGGRGYEDRGGGRGYEDRGGGRGYEDRGGYERNRLGPRGGEVWRGNYLGDNLGEGTIGFYGRTRRV